MLCSVLQNGYRVLLIGFRCERVVLRDDRRVREVEREIVSGHFARTCFFWILRLTGTASITVHN